MWLSKCYLIMQTIESDKKSYYPARPDIAYLMGIVIVLAALFMYFMSIKHTGIKKMIGGEAFDYSLAGHPEGGLNTYIDTPHYTASAFFLLAYSLINMSTKGIRGFLFL